MNRKIIFLFLAGVFLFFSGQGQAQNVAMESGSYIQTFENGKIDWQTGLVTAVGIGAPPANAVNMAQARAMALRAATVVARRNLLEIIKGVQIDSATTVENYMVTNDIIVSQVRGFLQNSQILDTAYMSDGSVEVTVGVSLRGGLANVIIPKTIPFGIRIKKHEPEPTPTVPSPPEVQEKEVSQPEPEVRIEPKDVQSQPKETAPKMVYTGLLVDARGLGARPAMSPKILDENGQEVYGSALVSREYAIQQGMAGYAKDVDKARQNPRVADTPYIAKAVMAKGRARTDLVIPNDVANQLRELAKNQSFLEKCKVMIVLD
ncbi:LPP20 family lipoprotein [Desulfovulcanus sp.]